MASLVPNFHFAGDCREAMALYQRALGAELRIQMTYTQAHPADLPQVPEGIREMIYHGEMEIAGQRVMMSDDPDKRPSPDPGISLVLVLDSPDQVREACGLLSEGGVIRTPLTETTYSGAFVSLVDRFGMRWELMTERAESISE